MTPNPEPEIQPEKPFYKRALAKTWLFTKRSLQLLGIYLLGYFFFAYLLSRITVEGTYEKDASIQIWLMKSGIHTDFILPNLNEIKDWRKEFPIENTVRKDTTTSLVAVGWGDKNFYMNTPKWEDLTFKTAFSAMTGLGTSSIHATYYYEVPNDKPIIGLHLSKKQYKKLVKYIEKTLQRTKDNHSVYIDPKFKSILGQNDAYYEANGNYSMFSTCNSWINEGLKAADKNACLWTPFAGGIFYQYGK